MLPPKDQPSAPKKAKKRLRRCQSLRPERSTAARLASTPGIIAPYSWPKLPRIPQPIESERPTQRKYKGHTCVPKIEIIRGRKNGAWLRAYTKGSTAGQFQPRSRRKERLSR